MTVSETLASFKHLSPEMQKYLKALEDYIGDTDGKDTVQPSGDGFIDDGTIDASEAVTAFNGIVAALTAALSDQVVVPGEQTYQTIWLQPWCDGCEKHCNSGEGRLWCQDDVWGQCEECDRKSVKYVIAAAPASTAGEVKSA